MDFYSCPVFEFYKQFGKKEMTLFRKPGVHTITPQPNILLKVEDMGETTLYLMVIKFVI